MILSVLGGTILLMAPFLLVFLFNDKVKGFSFIFIGTLSFHVLLGATTQFLHIFTYPVIISINLALAFFVLLIFLKKYKFKEKSLRIFRLSGLSFLVIASFFIVSFELFSVRYNYTGVVQTIRGVDVVTKDSYSYPIFSDEWIVASLADYSIENSTLPVINPLRQDKVTFFNLLLPFNILIAELFLVLGLSPVHHFALLAILFGVVVCITVYIAMRSFGISRASAAIGILFLPMITNGSNLPGIWFLIPYIVSMSVFFVFIYSLKTQSKLLVFSSAILSIILYPPMIVFVAPSVLGAYFSGILFRPISTRKIILYGIAVAIFAAIFICLCISFGQKFPGSIFAQISSGIFHKNLDEGIVSYSFWNIFPLILVPFAFIGLYSAIKSRIYHIILPLLVGGIFWIFYSFYVDVIVIEHPRVVVVTSMIIVIVSSLGIDYLWKYVSKKHPIFYNQNASWIFAVTVTIVFLFTSLFYPYNSAWRKLKLNLTSLVLNDQIQITPAPPINRYLTPGDIDIWKNISNERFISLPWKGLVIGVAMGNYPMESKPSTIGVKLITYEKFINADCKLKVYIAEKYKLKYVYTEPFNCDEFIHIDTSIENLHLYRYNSIK